MNVLYSLRETQSSGCVSLAAGDHVADVDNKELGLSTAERSGDVPRRETGENRLWLFTRTAGPMTGALVTAVTLCAAALMQ